MFLIYIFLSFRLLILFLFSPINNFKHIYSQILEKEMATHSSILAWRIPWTEEPGKLQSMGLQELDTTEQLKHYIQIWVFLAFLFSCN